MKQSQIIETVIYAFQPNELILASTLFNTKLDGTVCEATYYKTLERMRKAGKLNKAARGVYYLPKNSRFGPVPLSEQEIAGPHFFMGLASVSSAIAHSKFTIE